MQLTALQLLSDPQAWLSFLTLTLLEIVLGVDNIIFLVLIVDRLPAVRRRSARMLGLTFAMLTRIALLYSITWITRLTGVLFSVRGAGISGRDLVLFGGGVFLIVKSIMEIRSSVSGRRRVRKAPALHGFWLVIFQIGVIDIVFSLDSVFTAIGLAQHIAVMVAAIVASVLVMMAISAVVSAFIERYPRIKILALVFMVLVGVTLVGQAVDLKIPQGYLYFAMAVAGAVEWINLRMRKR